MDSLLEKHCAARDARVRETQPQIDIDQYVGEVLLDRSTRFAEHVASMTISTDIVQWALAMTRKHGEYVLVYHFVADWITALLILRYGEEPDAARSSDPNFAGWPLTFSDADRQRAADLLVDNDWPRGIFTLLPSDGNYTPEG